MDIKVRYGITGYIFIILIFLYSPTINDYLLSLVDKDSFINILLIGFLGFPIGYIINQFSSILFHLVPIFQINNKSINDKLIPIEAKEELDFAIKQIDLFKTDFNFREWYSWRWTHLTMNLNIITGAILSLVFCIIINGINDKTWLPDYSFTNGKWLISITLTICILAVFYNTYIYRWTMKKMNIHIQNNLTI